ncbi:MAG: nucleoside monophosphate kinase [Candidatus Pacebacteria bacterium]|nr:nucleoside monophosphate kinase [Candidatus Paceibacterota bacterium]
MDLQKKQAILVIGAPASGKGTQAELLAKKAGYYHFITSKEGKDYLAANKSDPETAKQEELYKSGKLFDPEWIFSVVKKRVNQIFEGGEKGIVFDGSPRTLFEAQNLLVFLSSLIGSENIKVIEVAVPEEELKRRTGERLVCDKNASHVFSTRLSDAKEGQKCPECEGVLRRRDLDSVFETRIENYRARTLPALEYLRKHGIVIAIDGERPVEEIHRDIVSRLGV